MSAFAELPDPRPDPVIALGEEADRCHGINVVIGAFRDDAGRPYVLPTVKDAESQLLNQINNNQVNIEYQPIEGDPKFRNAAIKLLFGQNFDQLARVASAQSLGGTGACRIAAAAFARLINNPETNVYISNPTWANHGPIFKDAGFRNVLSYRYFDSNTKGVNIEFMLEDLRDAPAKSVIVLHMCAHNPTGADPTIEEWGKIADIIQAKSHFVLFDAAYQGYATGDLDRDAAAGRLFLTRGLEFFTAQSFSKNLGLYGERVGCVSVVCATEAAAIKVQGLLKSLIRPMYSNPPAHGSRIATLVLTDDKLRSKWYAELKGMSERIVKMREELFNALTELKTPGDWSHIKKQIGMFSYLGLTEPQCLALRKRNIFLLTTGRASMAGLTSQAIPEFAKGIHDVVTGELN